MVAYNGQWRASSVGVRGHIGGHAEAALHPNGRVGETIEKVEHHLLGTLQLLGGGSP